MVIGCESEALMLIVIVARSRLDRYEDQRRQFEDWDDVWIVLDRRMNRANDADPKCLITKGCFG